MPVVQGIIAVQTEQLKREEEVGKKLRHLQNVLQAHTHDDLYDFVRGQVGPLPTLP